MPPYYVDLHVNAGECISLQLLDGQEQLVAGPTTITMISQQQSPPVPIPVQVPFGHMIYQIADENGTLKHIILSVMNTNEEVNQIDSGVITLPHGTFCIDPHGDLISVNPASQAAAADGSLQPGARVVPPQVGLRSSASGFCGANVIPAYPPPPPPPPMLPMMMPIQPTSIGYEKTNEPIVAQPACSPAAQQNHVPKSSHHQCHQHHHISNNNKSLQQASPAKSNRGPNYKQHKANHQTSTSETSRTQQLQQHPAYNKSNSGAAAHQNGTQRWFPSPVRSRSSKNLASSPASPQNRQQPASNNTGSSNRPPAAAAVAAATRTSSIDSDMNNEGGINIPHINDSNSNTSTQHKQQSSPIDSSADESIGAEDKAPVSTTTTTATSTSTTSTNMNTTNSNATNASTITTTKADDVDHSNSASPQVRHQSAPCANVKSHPPSTTNNTQNRQPDKPGNGNNNDKKIDNTSSSNTSSRNRQPATATTTASDNDNSKQATESKSQETTKSAKNGGKSPNRDASKITNSNTETANHHHVDHSSSSKVKHVKSKHHNHHNSNNVNNHNNNNNHQQHHQQHQNHQQQPTSRAARCARANPEGQWLQKSAISQQLCNTNPITQPKLVELFGKLVEKSLSTYSDARFAGVLLALFATFAMLLALLIHVCLV